MSNSVNFLHRDFEEKVEFFCRELDFDQEIVLQIKEILNKQVLSNPNLPNLNSQKTVKPLNSQLQIEKIDLENNLEKINLSKTNTNSQQKLQNIQKSNLNENLQTLQNSQNSYISSEQKAQIKLKIQNLIKQEYAQINGKSIEEIETELANWRQNKKEILEKKSKIGENEKFNDNESKNNSEKVENNLGNTNENTKLNLDFGTDSNFDNLPILPNDMAYVRGQIVAKRALEIAASGGHNVLFLGSPGSGKTLLARAYGGILPSMTEQEILEATQIYSVAGLLAKGEIIHKRPFRAPHHSASHVALVGGGSRIRPGEASLAHRGVLFLDEFPEFGRDTIEALRQPLEDGFVSIARASGSLIFPSKFCLLAAANPTPSGFDPDDPDALNKPQNRAAISRYQARFSGPIMDRIDIHVEVSRPKSEELQSTVLAEKSFQIAKRVQVARNIQTNRFANYYKDKPSQNPIQANSEMTLPMIQKFCVLDITGQKLLSNAIERFKLSARAYMRLLKLSRTIADLDNSTNILPKHLAESLQYRGRWS